MGFWSPDIGDKRERKTSDVCESCGGRGKVFVTYLGMRQKCGGCGGSGRDTDIEIYEECSKCHGTGKVEQWYKPFFSNEHKRRSVDCEECNGVGKLWVFYELKTHH